MPKAKYKCDDCKDTGWRTVRRGSIMDLERPCPYCDKGAEEREAFKKALAEGKAPK